MAAKQNGSKRRPTGDEGQTLPMVEGGDGHVEVINDAAVDEISKFEAERDALLAQAEQATKALLDSLQARREFLEEMRVDLRSKFEAEDANLRNELSQILEKLGLEDASEVIDNIDLEIPGGEIDEKEEDEEFTYLDTRLPKGLKLGVDIKGNAHDEEFWTHLMAWPFKEESAVPSSLDNFMLLAYYNAGPKHPVSTPVISAAVQALGHQTDSQKFEVSVSSANGRLRNDGLIKSVSRGTHVITDQGIKAAKKMIAAADAKARGKVEPAKPGRRGRPKGSRSAKSLKSGDLAGYALAAIAKSGKLLGQDIGRAIKEVGYDQGEQSMEDLRRQLRGTLKELTNENLIKVQRNEKDRPEFTLTPQGEEKAKSLTV